MPEQTDDIFANVCLDNIISYAAIRNVNGIDYEVTKFGNGKNLTEDGYVIVKKNRRFRFEHRMIAEKILGRLLASNEQVHHINGCKVDNRPENLLICTTDYHTDLHKRCLEKTGSWHLNLPRIKPASTTDALWECYHRREAKQLARARRNSRSSVNVTPTDSSFLN